MAEMTNQDFLQALLAPDNDVRKKVPMKRFGIDFEIKAMTPDEANKIQQRATRLGAKGQKIFNEELFNYLTIVKACVTPNWEDEKLLEAMKVSEGVEAVKERLLFGEVAYLLQEIASLNGFDKDDEEQITDIKN